MSEDALRKSLAACNVCNIALVDEVHERMTKGEKVNAICKDLEDFQRQMYGEVYYSQNALRARYRFAVGSKIDIKKGPGQSDQLEELRALADDKEVQEKIKRGMNIPPEKLEPVEEPVPAIKSIDDWADQARQLMAQANAIIAQRGHGFDEAQIKAIRDLVLLIFRNIGE